MTSVSDAPLVRTAISCIAFDGYGVVFNHYIKNPLYRLSSGLITAFISSSVSMRANHYQIPHPPFHAWTGRHVHHYLTHVFQVPLPFFVQCRKYPPQSDSG